MKEKKIRIHNWQHLILSIPFTTWIKCIACHWDKSKDINFKIQFYCALVGGNNFSWCNSSTSKNWPKTGCSIIITKFKFVKMAGDFLSTTIVDSITICNNNGCQGTIPWPPTHSLLRHLLLLLQDSSGISVSFNNTNFITMCNKNIKCTAAITSWAGGPPAAPTWLWEGRIELKNPWNRLNFCLLFIQNAKLDFAYVLIVGNVFIRDVIFGFARSRIADLCQCPGYSYNVQLEQEDKHGDLLVLSATSSPPIWSVSPSPTCLNGNLCPFKVSLVKPSVEPNLTGVVFLFQTGSLL